MSHTVDNLIGHYHRMFSFPGLRALLWESFVAGFFISALIALVSSNMLFSFITLSIIIILSQLLSIEFTFQITPSKRLLDRRRSAGLTFASSMLLFPSFLLALVGFTLAGDPNRVPFATLVISASLVTYLRYFTTYMYVEISHLKALIIALSQSTVLILGAVLLETQMISQIAAILASIIVSILIAELSIYLLKIRAFKLLNLNVIDVSRAFFAGWMGGEPEKLEKALEAEALTDDLEAEVIAVNRKRKRELKTVIIAPKIHAGPFRNLGSSNLPAAIFQKINGELHVPTLVFHGAVSHEKDLVYSRDLELVTSEILKALKQLPSEDIHHASMVVRTPEQMVGGLNFGGQLLVWVSLAPFLSEDLPNKLQLDVDTYAAQRNLRKALLLDTHSCLSSRQPTLEILHSLEDQIRQVVDKLAEKAPSQLEMGVATMDTHGFSSEEIAGLKGVAALLKTASDSQGMILFDSNNMTSELRQLLDECLPKALGAPVEVFTTDTHVLVGIRVKKDYSPIGEKTEKQLIVTRALEALQRAKSDLEPVTMSTVTVRIKNVPVLGAKGIEILGKAGDVMINLARRLLPVTLIGCALLTLLALFAVP